MKMHAKNRNVAIIGIGQTSLSSHKEDQNQVEMVQEAVINALADAGLKIGDIDCIVHGNMELFEMQFAPDLWHSLGTGAYGKDEYRITTGGTTGATLVCAADNLVASGLYDTVLAIGMEKLQEGNTTGGITNMGNMLGGMIMQPAVGWVLDRRWSGAYAMGVRVYDFDAYRAGFRPGGQRRYCNCRRYAGKAIRLLRRFGKGLVEDPT